MVIRFGAFIFLFFLGSAVFAASNVPVVYQARILKPDGSALEGVVSFQFTIKSPNNCILWTENQMVDMTGSKGAISVKIGEGSNVTAGTHGFSSVFRNSGSVSGLTGCTSGSIYSPNSDDDRTLIVVFDDGSGPQNAPEIRIKSVPFAQESFSTNALHGRALSNTAPTNGQALVYNSVLDQWVPGTPVVTAVQLVDVGLPTSIFSGSSGAITNSGTISFSLLNQAQNAVFAGPGSGGAGSPTFRSLVAADIPNLDAGKITSGTLSSAVLGSVSLGTTGVVAGNYGSGQAVSTFSVQTDGRLTVAGSVMISIDASQVSSGTFAIARIPDVDASKVVSGTFAAGRIPDLDAAKIISGTLDSARIPDLDAGKISSGTLAQARIGVVGNAAGGTGLDTSSAGAGQLLIGNGSGFSLGTLTAGNNISILNQNGTVTISSSNSGGTVTQVNTGTGLAGGPFTAVGTISLADTSVVAGGYGNAAYSTVFSVDAQGRLTSAGSTLISIGAGQVTSGTFNLAQVPDIDASKVVSGTLALARVPDLDAAKIVAGTLANARLPVSGVGAGTYGSASWIPTFITDIYGRLTSAGSVQVAIDASQVVSGTMGVNRGGTGVDGSAAANGQLLIGNGAGYALGTLTAGSNITITNSAGGITIASSNSGGTVTQVNSGTGLTGGPVSGVGTLSLADTSVTAGGYGAANYSTTLTVDQQGRLTAAGSTLIAINGNQVTGGTINLAQIPDIDASKVVSGTLGLARVPDLDAAKIVAGTLANARLPVSGVTAGAFSSSTFIPSFTVDAFGRLVSVGSNAISFPALQWTNVALGVNYASGSVGIGQATPATMLDVNGAIRIANDGTACAAGLAGAIRYNAGFVEYCNGSGPGWQTLGISGSGVQSLNGLTANSQIFAVGSTGTLAAFTSAGSLHTLNIPLASTAGAAGGLVTNADYLTLMNGTIPAGRVANLDASKITTGTLATAVLGVVPGANGGTVTQVNTGTGLSGGPFTAVGTISLADTAVTAGVYGSAAYSTTLTVDQQGRLTSAGSTLIAINGNQITSGTINLAQVPDIDAGKVVSGTLANARLPLSGATASNVGSSSYIPTLSIDAFGRITSYGSAAVSIPAAITSINGLTASGQVFVVGSSGTLAAFSSAGSTNTLNIPMASGAGVAGGLLSNSDYLTLTNGTIPSGRIADLDASKITSGTLSVLRGGTGLDGSSAANGQLLIGNGSGYALGTLTAGTNITITNSAGGITIASSNSGGTVTQVNSGTGLTGGPINGVGTLSLANTAVTAGGYGNAAYSTTLTVDQQGRLTAAGSTLIAINGNQIISGTINLAQVPDLDAGKIVSGTFATARLPVSGVAAGTFSSSTYVPSFTVDAYGRLVSVGSNAISFPALQWTNVALGVNYASGSVGIGQASPVTMLDVAGAIRIANDATACAAGLAGAIRYNSGFVEYCNGSGPGWQTLGISGAGIQSLNGLTGNSQQFAVGSSGTLAAFSSAGTLHTLNIPLASTAGAAGGLLSNADYLTLTNGTIPAGRIADLDASKITTGTLATAVLGVVPGANGGTVTQVNSGTGLTGGPISGVGTLSLTNTAVTPGGYGNAAYSTTLTVDQQGRLTAAGSTAIAIDGSQVTAGTFANARLPLSGAAAGSVGSATYIPTLTVDAFGRITSYGSAAISAPASITSINGLTAAGQIFVVGTSGTLAAFSSAGSTNTLNIPMASAAGVAGGLLSKIDYDSFAAGASLAANGTIPVARGGTGLNGSSAANGQLLIGNGAGYSLGTLISGSGITILNQSGSITISANNSGSVTQVNTGAGLVGGPITGVGTVSLGTTGVVASSVGSSGFIPQITFDAYGRITAVGSAAVAINASAISGTLGVDKGGTGLNASSAANGALLIGNGSGFTLGTLVASNGVLLSSGAGSVGISTNAAVAATGNTIVMRDGSGNTTSAQATATSLRLDNGGAYVTLSNPIGANYSMVLPANMGSPGQVLSTNGTSQVNWTSVPTNGGTFLAASGSVGTPGFAFATDPDSGLWNPGANTLSFSTNGQQRMTFNSSGLVGIGTNDPQTLLHLFNGPDATLAGGGIITLGPLNTNNIVIDDNEILARNNGVNSALYLQNTGGETLFGGQANVFYDDGSNSGSHTLFRAYRSTGNFTGVGLGYLANGTDDQVAMIRSVGNFPDLAFSSADGTERMRLTNSGSLGIGISSPVTRLDINGAIRIANDSATCAAPNAGAIRYNSGTLEYCNGVGPAWLALGVSGAGLQSLNGLTAGTQLFAVGSSGTLAAFSSAGSLHTLNIPMASTANAVGGLISKADYDLFNAASTNSLGGTISAANGSAAGPTFTFASDKNTGLYRIGEGTIGFATEGNLKAQIGNNNGFEIFSNTYIYRDFGVGSGFNGASGNGHLLLSRGAGNFSGLRMGYWSDGANDIGGAIASASDGGTSNLIFATSPSGTLTEQMRILSTGAVGMGTTVVGAGNRLEVTGGAIAAGNGGQLRMMENLSQGGNFVALRARGTLASDLTWLLPDSLGTAGQTMTVGSGGTLYWSTPSAGVTYPLLSTTLGSVGTPVYSFNADTDTGLYSPGTGTLAITTNGTNRINIGSDGFVGIGTSTPSTNLEVVGSARFGIGGVVVGTGSSTTYFDVTVNNGAGAGFNPLASIKRNAGNFSGIEIGYLADGSSDIAGALGSNSLAPLALTVNGSEKVRITSAGSVGIGTTSPLAQLDVQGVAGGTNVKLGATDKPGIISIGVNNEIWTDQGVNGNTSLDMNYRGYNGGFTQPRSFQIFDGQSNIIAGFYGSTRVVGIGTTAVRVGNRLEVTGGAIAAGNGAELRMMENLSQGTNFVALKARGTLASDLTWLLPDSLGTAGQTMTVGSGGTLYWSTPSGGVTFPLLSTTRGSVATPAYSFSSDTDTGIYSPGANTLAISTAGTARITISEVGNIGIGVSSAAESFHLYRPSTTMLVEGDSSANFWLLSNSASQHPVYNIVRSRSGGAVLSGDTLGEQRFSGVGGGAWREGANIRAEARENFSGTTASTDLIFSTTPRNTVSAAERIRITSGGSVGIGNSAPATLLDVGNTANQNTVRVTGDVAANRAPVVELYRNGAAVWSMGIVGSSFHVSSNPGGYTDANLSAAAALTITNGGSVGIGYGATAPSARLDVLGSIRSTSSILAGAGTITFLPPLSGTLSLRMPSSVGSPGQALTTDGTGNLSWSAAGDSVGTDADALSALTVDFSSSTGVRATGAAAACGTLNVTNLTAGKNYTVTILNATASCSTIHWNGAATNVKLPSSYSAGAPLSGAIYSFYYDGLTVWVSMVPY